MGIPLTYCADGSFCCGTNYTVSATNDGSEDCCKQKGGLFLTNREPTTATPSPSGTIAAPTTAAASTQSTTTGTASSSPASSPVSKSTNTGAIIGGVVGGIAAVAILSLAFWYFMIRRVVKQTAQPSSHAQAPYDKSRQQMWQEPKEVPGNEFRGELAAAAMTAELDSRQHR